MIDLSMGDPKTFWLNVTNIGLGVVIAICVVVICVGVLRDVLVRRRSQAAVSEEIDRDMKTFLGPENLHTFAVPGLGLTMADGGEKLPDNEKSKGRA